MDMKPGFKLTECGLIPEDWESKVLWSVAAISHGFGFQSRYFTPIGKYRLTTPGHFFETGGFRDIGNKQKFYDGPIPKGYILDKDDVVIAMTEQADGLLGSAAAIPISGTYLHNQRLGKLIVTTPDVCIEYLFRVFNSPAYRLKVRETAAGTKVKHTSPSKLLEIAVALPSFKTEQIAVAKALNEADALVETLEQLLAKKRLIKQGAMQQLLTGKKRLPGFTDEWKSRTLSDLFSFSGGYTASRDQLSAEGHCYLHYGDIHAAKKTFIDVKSEAGNIPRLDIPLKKVNASSLLEDGDIVFVDASEDDEGASRHVVIDNPNRVPFISGLHTIVAKTKTDQLHHGYRRYCFQTAAIKKQFLFYAVGTKVSGISKTNIAKISLPVPPVAEQAAIAAILADLDSELEAIDDKIAKARQIKQGMMQELLTGRIRLK